MAEIVITVSEKVAEAIGLEADLEGISIEDMAKNGVALYALRRRIAREAIAPFPEPDNVLLNLIVMAQDENTVRQYYLNTDPSNLHYMGLTLFDEHSKTE